MPLDDNLRLQILSINCPTQRLRRELEIVRKVIKNFIFNTFLWRHSFPRKCFFWSFLHFNKIYLLVVCCRLTFALFLLALPNV